LNLSFVSLQTRFLWGTVLVLLLVMAAVITVVEHGQRAAIIEEVQRREAHPVTVSLGPLPPVEGDLSLLRQVFLNLIANAFKFSRHSPKPMVEIGGREEKNENVYYVKDNGVGFDMAYVHKLFGVFQRLHNEEEFEGTGIGLSIVSRVIHRHGGKVWGEGQVNGGASFSFSLPKIKSY